MNVKGAATTTCCSAIDAKGAGDDKNSGNVPIYQLLHHLSLLRATCGCQGHLSILHFVLILVTALHLQSSALKVNSRVLKILQTPWLWSQPCLRIETELVERSLPRAHEVHDEAIRIDVYLPGQRQSST